MLIQSKPASQVAEANPIKQGLKHSVMTDYIFDDIRSQRLIQ